MNFRCSLLTAFSGTHTLKKTTTTTTATTTTTTTTTTAAAAAAAAATTNNNNDNNDINPHAIHVNFKIFQYLCQHFGAIPLPIAALKSL